MENSLAKKVESTEVDFFTEAMKTLPSAKSWAQMILDSKMCPKHFYETKMDEKKKVPDYTKGNVGAVLMVIQHGNDVGISASQALQQIVPINGLMSIKGDLGKALIFRSGKLKKGSWQEKEEGTIADKTFKVTITAQREDNGEILTRSFSIEDAMRAGLWVTDRQLNAQDSWKVKLSPWYRYPDRMIKYRALGFIERDLFPDVLCGMVTEEEAIDYPVDEGVITLKTKDGAEVHLDHPTHRRERSQDITNDTVKKIDQALPEKKKSEPVKKYTDKLLLNMGTKIYKLAETIKSGYDPEPLSALLNSFPGKKSNKKYREAILALQEDKFFDLLKKWGVQDPKKEQGPVQGRTPTKAIEEQSASNRVEHIPNAAQQDGNDLTPKGQAQLKDETLKEKKDPDQEQFEDQFSDQREDSAGKPPEEEKHSTNKYNLEIPKLGENGSRPFDEVKTIYENLNELGVDNERWFSITKGHELGEQFKDKEDFCRSATINKINELLNSL